MTSSAVFKGKTLIASFEIPKPARVEGDRHFIEISRELEAPESYIKFVNKKRSICSAQSVYPLSLLDSP